MEKTIANKRVQQLVEGLSELVVQYVPEATDVMCHEQGKRIVLVAILCGRRRELLRLDSTFRDIEDGKEDLVTSYLDAAKNFFEKRHQRQFTIDEHV
jgi:hypothetical protein